MPSPATAPKTPECAEAHGSRGRERSPAVPCPFDPYRRKLGSDQINALPLRRYEGPIHLVREAEHLDEALESLAGEALLGFDTETKPSFKKGQQFPTSLVQLAGAHCVVIFQLTRLPVPKRLLALLADPGVVKTGVAVWDDVRELKGLAEFQEAGFVDLGDVSKELDLPTNGLRNLAANLLGYRISKGARRSDWGRRKLSAKQVRYAATDAWVSREIYLRLDELGAFHPPPRG